MYKRDIRNIIINEGDAPVLLACIDAWLEGLPTAEAATESDKSIEDVEEFVAVMGDYNAQRTSLERIRKEVSSCLSP